MLNIFMIEVKVKVFFYFLVCIFNTVDVDPKNNSNLLQRISKFEEMNFGFTSKPFKNVFRELNKYLKHGFDIVCTWILSNLLASPTHQKLSYKRFKSKVT